MAGLIAGHERIMDVALQSESLAADGVNDRVAITAQIGVFSFKAVYQLKRFRS